MDQLKLAALDAEDLQTLVDREGALDPARAVRLVIQAAEALGDAMPNITEDGETFAGPTLQLTLPVFDRNQAARSEAAADRAVAQGSTTALAARIASEQHNAADRTRAADALEALLEADPTADAQAALDSLEAGYAAGELDLPQTLLLQRQVLDGQAAIVHLQAAIARARIDLLLATDDPSLTKNVEHGVR